MVLKKKLGEKFNSLITLLSNLKKKQDGGPAQEWHKALFESSRDSLMTLAPPSWHFTAGNPATVEMFLAKNETDFISRAPWQYSPETQPDGHSSDVKAREMIETALQEGSHFFEWTHKRLDGAPFPATVLLTRMKFGEQTSLQATVRDITTQKRAEQKLLKYQEQLRSLGSQLVVTEEAVRRNLATRLHDSIGQDLALIKMKLKALSKQVEKTKVQQELDAIFPLLTQAIAQTRSLTFELSSPVLHELGFEAALERLTETFGAQHNIEVSYQTAVKPARLPQDAEIILYQAVRELMMNAVKHAAASEILVRICLDSSNLQIEVRNNGVGIDLQNQKPKPGGKEGFGLFNIRERLQLLGGTLEIISQPDTAGTSMILKVPLSV